MSQSKDKTSGENHDSEQIEVKNKIYFALIANSQKILCEHSKYRTIFDDYTTRILQVLEPGRKVISYKKVHYVYLKDSSTSLTFMMLTTAGYPQQYAFKMLDYIKSHFYAKFSKEKIRKAGF